LASAWKVLPGAGTGPPLPFQEHSSCDDAAERLQGALQWADALLTTRAPKNYDFLRLAGRATICRCGEAGTPRPRHGTAGKQTVAMGAGATVSPARPLEVPAIVTPKPKASQRDVKLGNDNRPEDPKARIVRATKPKGRRKVWADEGQETPSKIKALIARMMLGRGPGSST
jgi:hypothetical protein